MSAEVVTTRVGGEARLNCSSTPGGSVEWKRIFSKGSSFTLSYIYVPPNLHKPYATGGRHNVSLDPLTGACDLMITNVTEDDAGKYVCTETKERNTSNFELVVLLGLCNQNNQKALLTLIGTRFSPHVKNQGGGGVKNPEENLQYLVSLTSDFDKCITVFSQMNSGADPGIYFRGAKPRSPIGKLRAKPESRARSARVSRAKSESRARSARELRAKPEPRTKPRKSGGRGLGRGPPSPSPENF